jgi:hypothetical protein
VLVLPGSFFCIPTHRDCDVIVAAGNLQRKEVVDLSKDFYTNIGYAAVVFVKYIFIPL